MPAAADLPVRFVLSPPGHLGPFRAAVAERTGGTSPAPFASLNVGRSTDDEPGRVQENERIILQSLGLADRVARLRLEHGARVLPVETPGMHGPADALLSADPSLVLWFTIADCVPLSLAAGPWRAHGHCGWRGIVAGLPGEMARALGAAAGTGPEAITAWIGPGIGPCCFEVDPDVAAQFDAASVRIPGRAPDGPASRFRVDLQAEIRLRLAQAGLPAGAVAADRSCTRCEADRFFSHRRDGVPTGRLAALCWHEGSGDQARDTAGLSTSA